MLEKVDFLERSKIARRYWCIVQNDSRASARSLRISPIYVSYHIPFSESAELLERKSVCWGVRAGR